MNHQNPLKLSPQTGLCAVCRHQKIIESARGSQFILCQKSKTDSRFTKYPRLPVLRCIGFEAEDSL